MKGSLYRGTQSYFESRVPGGLARLLETMGPGPLADFIAQRFVASQLYDIMPVPALIAHEARCLGMSIEEYLLPRTEWQADQDIRGPHKFLLRVARPDRVISRLPMLLIRMFDFPSVDVEVVSKTERIAVFRRIPKPLGNWLHVGLSVYTKRVLQAAGADQVDVEHLPSSEGISEVGLSMQTMRMRISWR